MTQGILLRVREYMAKTYGHSFAVCDNGEKELGDLLEEFDAWLASVPKEPTVEMLKAATEVPLDAYSGTYDEDVIAIYKAMISAAQKKGE